MQSQQVEVFLGLGSNIDPIPSLRAGLAILRKEYGVLECSSVYESAAVGFEGPAFLNLAVKMVTALPLADLIRGLRHIEYQFGRPLSATPFSSRRLDIDILLYGDKVGEFSKVILPRPEILYNAHVLVPLAELIPDWRHSVAQLPLRDIAVSNDSVRKVRKISFDFDRLLLSGVDGKDGPAAVRRQ